MFIDFRPFHMALQTERNVLFRKSYKHSAPAERITRNVVLPMDRPLWRGALGRNKRATQLTATRK